MEGAEKELERRSKFLSGLIQKKKALEQKEQNDKLNVRVRASDMPLALQNRAFKCAREQLDSMTGKLDSKRLALALKKVDSFVYQVLISCFFPFSFSSYFGVLISAMNSEIVSFMLGYDLLATVNTF